MTTTVSWMDYLDQGEYWLPSDRPKVAIADMDLAWRSNAAAWLERRAELAAFRYGMAEAWFAVECSSPIGPSDSSQDGIRRDIEQGDDERRRDPVGWLRNTTLYRALVADLPTDPADAERLAGRARHYSTCVRRAGEDGDCTCHLSECAISDGHPELGCTCRDVVPEWTLS